MRDSSSTADRRKKTKQLTSMSLPYEHWHKLVISALVYGILSYATDWSSESMIVQPKRSYCKIGNLPCLKQSTSAAAVKPQGSRSRNFTKLAKKPSAPSTNRNETGNREAKIQCKYCGGIHQRKKKFCAALRSRCRICGRNNHFAKVCLQKATNPQQKPLHSVTENDSSDSGDSVLTVELSPTGNESILAVQETDSYQSRLFTTMDIKGGNTIKFQIDTGATCNVLKESELKGTKY